MEKQITTVYVPDKSFHENSFEVGGIPYVNRVRPIQAYIYTPEEHAAVQGYILDLEKVIDMARDYNDGWVHSIDDIQQAISKAEDKGKGMIMTECYFTPSKKTTSATICENCGQEKYLHTIGDGVKASSVIINSTPQPTNSLDKLERWVEESWSTQTMIWIHKDQLLSKIQSLKQPDVSDINVGNIPNNGWISVEDRLPEMIAGKDYSENVIVWLDGERKIMNYALIPDDNNNLCYAWCMVYDGLDGDAEFDDNYYPTHWQPLPPKP